MIRLVLASASPVAVGLAAAFLVGPSTFGVPRGEPIVVAGSKRLAALHNVRDRDCPRQLLAGTGADGAEPGTPARIRVVTVGRDVNQPALAVADLPFDGAPGTTIVLLVDPEGRLLAAGDAAAAPVLPLPTAAHDCDRDSDRAAAPGVI